MSASSHQLRNKHACARKCGGFTLFEMVLAMLVLALLSGAIFSIVRTTLQATAVTEAADRRNDERSSFTGFLRRTFEYLPNQALISYEPAPEQTEQPANIVLRNAPSLFPWKSSKRTPREIRLGLRKQQGGGYTFAIAELDRSPRQTAISWFTLLPGFDRMDWRFFDLRTQQWRSDWPPGLGRPALMELIFKFTDETEATKLILWMPSLQGQQAVPLPNS